VSTFQERRELRDLVADLTAKRPERRRSRRWLAGWIGGLAANAVPIVATLALVWLATVSLVVINYFVSFNLVALIYMLPVAGPLSIDLVSRLVTLDGRRVQLTRKEYALLHGLAVHIGLVVTHQQLIKDIWGSRSGNIQYLRILVRKLRQKIEVDPTQPQLLVSESGVGYRLDQGGTAERRGMAPAHCA
jgi:Transcriptional regulatory protein, C terminal